MVVYSLLGGSWPYKTLPLPLILIILSEIYDNYRQLWLPSIVIVSTCLYECVSCTSQHVLSPAVSWVRQNERTKRNCLTRSHGDCNMISVRFAVDYRPFPAVRICFINLVRKSFVFIIEYTTIIIYERLG